MSLCWVDPRKSTVVVPWYSQRDVISWQHHDIFLYTTSLNDYNISVPWFLDGTSSQFKDKQGITKVHVKESFYFHSIFLKMSIVTLLLWYNAIENTVMASDFFVFVVPPSVHKLSLIDIK